MEMKILVVDDVLDITDLLEIELSEHNFHVISKNSGYDALRYLMENEVDLLLSDIAMPDMNGFELFSRVQDLKDYLPVILMTGFGYDPNHVVVKSKLAGLKDVVYKPFNMDKLVTLINKRIAESKDKIYGS